MVQEYISHSSSTSYEVGEYVDCEDEKGVWLNAEILEISGDRLKVHFTNYNKKFDSWVPISNESVLKQWRRGSPFQLHNRIDVKDTYNKWMEATIVDMNSTQIRVHFKGYTERWDEWINKNSERISEIGSKSTAFGIGKFDPSRPNRFSNKEIQTSIISQDFKEGREGDFMRILRERDFLIVPVEGDGNCLFRSVSHQLYGTTEHHGLVRQAALNYLSIEREYFSQFIVGGDAGFDEYVSHQSQNGAWGDDIEIEAMSELYDRSIEIYAYANQPMRTFHESYGEGTPIRLAYHGRSHYNSIIGKDGHEPLLTSRPGEFEEIRIQLTKRISQGLEPRHENIRRAREGFDNSAQTDLEQALSISLHNSQGNSVDVAIERSINEQTEEQMIRQAIEESKRGDDDAQLRMAMELSMQGERNTEEDLIRMAMEESKREASQNFLNPSIQIVVDSGFTMEQALGAWTVVGDDPNLMIEYILNSQF
ncbi:unnamed protein product [Blepharisma stoltei]|uniref:ubiquitinyl hydrolase 1 n=1 Tax=Blepharisma stoltei TaxID=1481888 RepID=A0AAU9JLT0_9CILI|nr:unnamed protein product [Blepharisma stoltei]